MSLFGKLVTSPVTQQVTRRSMDELLDIATTYGRPGLTQMDGGQWWARIDFVTLSNISLQASSKFNPDRHAAMEEAIANAIIIKDQFK